MATREYTIPNKYEGGYSTYNKSADMLANADLINEDITSLKQKREKIASELADLKSQREKFDILSVNVPELSDEDKENINAQQFRAGAEAMMEYDPSTAQSWLLRADEIEARKQNRTREQTPDAARQQLRIARDRAMAIVSSDSDQVSSADRELAKKIALIYTTEMSKPNPSTQFAEIKIDELYKSQLTPNGAGGGATNYNSILNTINETFKGIKYKGADLDNASNTIRQTIKGSGLSESDQTKLLGEMDAQIAQKQNAPKGTDVDKEVDKLFGGSSTEPIPAAYGRYDKSYNAYNAAKSAFDAGAVGASIGNFLYSLRPEAVNEGDIELAKNSVRSGDQQALKTVLDKVGMGGLLTTDYKTLATQLGRAAYNKLIDDRKANTDQIVALMNKLNPDQVRKRSLTYYKIPNKLGGSAGNTTPPPTTGATPKDLKSFFGGK